MGCNPLRRSVLGHQDIRLRQTYQYGVQLTHRDINKEKAVSTKETPFGVRLMATSAVFAVANSGFIIWSYMTNKSEQVIPGALGSLLVTSALFLAGFAWWRTEGRNP